MSGIFPSGGTDPENTLMAQAGLKLVGLCKSLFYRTNCNPRFDPVAMNALISEIANAVNKLGVDYDCSKLTNLATAVERGTKTNLLDQRSPDADDKIRGSYDNVEGWATVKELLELAPGIMDGVDDLKNDDVVLIGRAGKNAANEDIVKGRRMTVDAFRKLLAPPSAFGKGYTWKDRWPEWWGGPLGPRYGHEIENALDVPIMVDIYCSGGKTPGLFIANDGNKDWMFFGNGAGNSQEVQNISFILPPGGWYRNEIERPTDGKNTLPVKVNND